MIPKSVRWRLPLSYAAIALLAALALGLVLLTTLREHYRQQELDYLTNNAQAMGATIERLLELEAPPTLLQSQLRSLAFLSQTRVRLFDTQGQVLADSGDPQGPREIVSVSVAEEPSISQEEEIEVWSQVDALSPPLSQTITRTVERQTYWSFIGIEEDVEVSVIKNVVALAEPEVQVVVEADDSSPGESSYFSRINTSGTPYGFGLNAETVLDGRRSKQSVRQSYYSQSGELLGYVELSDGPAYGWQILDRVTQGGIIAGSVAVLLAALAGWLASRRLTTPLLALTDVTTLMAGGDLSARADVAREDELGLLANSFNDMADQVQGTVAALRRFVADAAHELHTPLTALRTNLELVADERDHARQRDFVARAQTQVARLDALTRALLDLSQLESGAAQEAAPVELSALLRETIEPYASRAEQAGLVFALDLPDAPVTVQGERGQLRQALGNLLDNALKFTPQGGEVRVGLRQEGAWVSLWVQDSGMGIPAEDLPGLFERFHRGRNAAPYPGSGLGLAIVKAIVQRHRGQVAAQNLRKGARFTVRLPAISAAPISRRQRR